MERGPTTAGKALLLGAGGIGYGALLFVWFSLPAYLAPIIDALGLSGTQAGVLAGAVPLTYIPLGLASGLAIDRIGARPGIGAGIVLTGIGQLGRSVAPAFPSMLLSTLAVGVGATGLTFGLPKLAAELYPPRLVGRAASAYLVASYAGSAAAFSLGRPVLGPALGGFRPLFLVSGAATLVIAAAFALIAWWVPAGRHGGDSGAFTAGSLLADVRTVLANRDLRLLVLLGTMHLFVVHGLQGWLVTLLEARGVAAGVAGSVTAVFVVGQVGGVLAVPAVAERLGRTRGVLVACCAIAFLGAGGLLTEPAIPLVLAVPIGLVGVGVGGISPLVRAIPVELDGIGAALTGTAVGLVFAVGEAGGFLGPVAIGALRDATGSFAPGVTLCAAAALVAAAAGASISEV